MGGGQEESSHRTESKYTSGAEIQRLGESLHTQYIFLNYIRELSDTQGIE